MVRTVYTAYEALKDARKMLDFDDLLLKANEMMQTDEAFAKRMQARFSHISVDEFQDVNLIQWDLLRKLAENHHNLLVVGDDMQSVYSFRGARPELILQFARYYPEAKTILLERNYRSREPVIAASNRVIALNARQLKKRVTAHRKGGEPVRTLFALDEYDQAERVVQTIQSLKLAFPELTWASFAVLYRTNQESVPFEEVFTEQHVPYELTDGTHFFDNHKVKTILAYMRLLEALNHHELPEMDDLLMTLKHPKGTVNREALERVQVHGMEVIGAHADYAAYVAILAQLAPIHHPTTFIHQFPPQSLHQGNHKCPFVLPVQSVR